MHDKIPDTPEELELILQAAGSLVGRDVQPAEFLMWFRSSVPTMAPQFAKAMSTADGGSGALIYGMGRALWNAMPQPSNRYRPRPLPKPNRNGRCPCGSGRKFRQCCAQLEPPVEMFESMNLLRYVLDGESKASLKRINARAMEPAALDDVAHQWAHQGEFERALALLEPLFDAGTKPPKYAELLLDTLFDTWPPDHKPQRRRRLAERLAEDSNPEVACVALHRCIVILADEGSMVEAWRRFHDGMHLYPEDVNFAAVELMLLMTEDRVDDARRRAEYWVDLLRLKGARFDAYAERLLLMVEPREDFAGLDQLRAESPLVDKLASLIQAPPIRTEGYRPRPAHLDEPIVLAPVKALAATERRWSEALGVDERSMLASDVDKQLLGPEQILALIEQDTALMHSFDVLDDLGESLDALTDERAELGVVLELVLQRAETMLLAIVTGSTPTDWVTADTWRDSMAEINHVLPWGFMENRPALRLMALHIDHLKYRNVGSLERWLPRAQVMLRLNPEDNHGYRELVSTELLRQRNATETLALLDKYPDDAMGAVCMNRVLAFFLLDRLTEAAIFLRNGGTLLREMRKAITQERYAKPRDALEDSIIIGGRDEAWIYRQEMLATWKETGAIKWLKRQPARRNKPQRVAKRMSAGSSETRDTSGVMMSNEESESPSDTLEDVLTAPSPLSHQALQACMDDLAPHGEWLLGLTLAAAITPRGGVGLKRLFQLWLDRLGIDKERGNAREIVDTLSESVDIANENAPQVEESIVRLSRLLDHFLSLFQHFYARFDNLATLPVDAELDAQMSKTGEVNAEASFDWVAEDLSVVSLDDSEVRLSLVTGLVASIDGNPRGWSPIPTGPRNNVIGPFRLMVASAGDSLDSDNTASANASLLDSDDSTFQMNREQCVERIIELVRLARLAGITRR